MWSSTRKIQQINVPPGKMMETLLSLLYLFYKFLKTKTSDRLIRYFWNFQRKKRRRRKKRKTVYVRNEHELHFDREFSVYFQVSLPWILCLKASLSILKGGRERRGAKRHRVANWNEEKGNPPPFFSPSNGLGVVPDISFCVRREPLLLLLLLPLLLLLLLLHLRRCRRRRRRVRLLVLVSSPGSPLLLHLLRVQKLSPWLPFEKWPASSPRNKSVIIISPPSYTTVRIRTRKHACPRLTASY